MKRRAIQVCVVFFPTPIPASAHVHTHARVNAHTRIHLMLNAPKRGTFKLQALDPSLGQSVSGSSSSSSSTRSRNHFIRAFKSSRSLRSRSIILVG